MIIRALLALAGVCACWSTDLQAMSAKEEKMAEAAPVDVAGPEVLILQSNDGKKVAFDKSLWMTSGTLNHLFIDTVHDFEKPIPISRYTHEQLQIARSLMELERELASNNDVDQRAEAIKHKLNLNTNNGEYYSKVFDLASYFDLPVAQKAIADSALSPEFIHDKQVSYSSYSDLLLDEMQEALSNRILLAKEKYLQTGNASDPYFTGVSIQDLIDHGKIPAIGNEETIDLSSKHINSLEGLQNIPKIDTVKNLSLYDNRIDNLEGIQFPQSLIVLSLNNNPIPQEQINELKNALPNTVIIQ